MSVMQTIRRVTVYADGSLEARLLKQFLALGSTGYTVLDCRGKGEHDTVDDPFSQTKRVKIELLVRPEVADKIVDHLEAGHYQRRAVSVYVQSVEVPAVERY
jgi:nitrogen regulatory protein PII